jgi:hypothetical protein
VKPRTHRPRAGETTRTGPPRTSLRPGRTLAAAVLAATLRGAALAAVASVALTPAASDAQQRSDFTVTTQLSRREIAVGERVELVLKIVGKERVTARDPVLAVPRGLLLDGPSTSVSSRSMTINGRSTTESTVKISFGLTGNQPGSYDIPAPTITLGTTILSGQPTKLVVSGSALSAPAPLPDDIAQDADDDNPTAKSLALPGAPTDPVFLHARVDKEKVLVGEQVTMSTYLYYRVGYEMTERTDPRYPDLLRFPLLQDPGGTQPVYTRVGSMRYGARLVDRVALIPLRAGKLSTGVSSARLTGRQIGSRVLKVANDITLDVVEPPVDGRPAGYVIGDVGQFSLSASVRPRTIKQGGSVAVTVKVEGTGYVPTAIKTPDVTGAKWLGPDRKDAVSTRGGRIGGSRTLEYVVRLENAGLATLGSVELPYFDPVSGRYEVTKVDLGTVEVEERPPTKEELQRAKDAKGQPDNDPLSGLPKLRTSMSAFAPRRSSELSTRALAAGVSTPPLLALLLLAGSRLKRTLAARSGRNEALLERDVKRGLADALAAKKSGDAKAFGAAVERAIASAVERHVGLRVRGISNDALARELEGVGVGTEAAIEVASLLSRCDDLRFLPSSEAADPSALEALLGRAKKLTKELAG